jgi:hypothetical protein
VADPYGIHSSLDFDNAPLLPNSIGLPKQSDYDFAYPPGTIFAVKEPRTHKRYFRSHTRHFIGGKFPLVLGTLMSPNMLVDCPTDIVVLKPDDELLKGVIWQELEPSMTVWEYPIAKKRTVEEWKDSGSKVSFLASS